MVLGCKKVPCRIMFEKINPNGGNNNINIAQGFKAISIIGTRAKLIEK